MNTIDKDTTVKKRRYKGDGSHFQRSNGMWVARYKGVSKESKTENEAKRNLRKIKEDFARGEVSPTKTTLLEMAQNWLEVSKAASVKEQSYDRLERTIENQIKPYGIADILISKITQDDLQLYINELSGKYSLSTIKKSYQAVSSILNKAYANGYIRKNPMIGVELPIEENVKVHEKEIEIFTKKEIEAVKKICLEIDAQGKCLYRYGDAFILIFNTGIRGGEALALKWEDVDFDNRQIYIKSTATSVKNRSKKENVPKLVRKISTTKTKKGKRPVPINSRAVEALKRIKERDEKDGIKSEFVICTKTGKMPTAANLLKYFKSIQEKAGVKPRGVHSLRHTFASIMIIDRKVDIKIVSQLLGHSSTEFCYRVYVHVKNEEQKEALEEFGEHIG